MLVTSPKAGVPAAQEANFVKVLEAALAREQEQGALTRKRR
jgi:hypothetical protein